MGFLKFESRDYFLICSHTVQWVNYVITSQCASRTSPVESCQLNFQIIQFYNKINLYPHKKHQAFRISSDIWCKSKKYFVLRDCITSIAQHSTGCHGDDRINSVAIRGEIADFRAFLCLLGVISHFNWIENKICNMQEKKSCQ